MDFLFQTVALITHDALKGIKASPLNQLELRERKIMTKRCQPSRKTLQKWL